MRDPTEKPDAVAIAVPIRRRILRIAWLGLPLILAGLTGTAAAKSLQFIKADAVPNATSVVTAPDNKYLYAVQPTNFSVSVYTRDLAKGDLAFASTITNTDAPGLRYPSRLAVSPDGTRVYVACQASLDIDGNGGSKPPDTLVVLNRSATTGTLSYRETHTNGTGGVSGIGFPTDVIVSADGAHVYVVGSGDNAIAMFARNATSGGLSFVERYTHGAAGVTALQQPRRATLSADGKSLYVAATASHALAIFARDATTGKLQWVGALQHATARADGLLFPEHVAGSSDGNFLYVAGATEGAGANTFIGTIGVLSRDATTGALQVLGAAQNGSGGFSGIATVIALELSGDGSKLFAVSPGDDALTVLRRDPQTGALAFIESHVNGVAKVDGLNSVLDLAVSHDGRFVYALGTDDKAGVFGAVTTDLALSVESATGVRVVNQPIQFLLKVANTTNDAIASVATLSGTLSASLNITSVTTANGSCAFVAPALNCTLGQLLPGAVATVQIASLPTQTQTTTIEAVAFADEEDVNTANNAVSVPVAILEKNTAPVANDDEVVAVVNTPLVIDAAQNDVDPDPNDVVSVKSVDAASAEGGTVTKNADGTITYSPRKGYAGKDSFNYIAADVQGAEASATVHVFVNWAPVAGNDEITIKAGESATILVLANDYDPDPNPALTSDNLTVVEVDVSTIRGSAVVTADQTNDRGAVLYTAPRDFVGDEVFSYSVSDKHGTTVVGQVTIHVVDGNTTQPQSNADETTRKKKKGGAVGPLPLILLVLARIYAVRSGRRDH